MSVSECEPKSWERWRFSRVCLICTGRTVAVIPTNIMSVLVPVDGPANAQFDNYQPFSKSNYRQ